ncbi:MAG: alpha-L-rhamnosidase, partial [Anaerolineae bacterium]|nr:alpha-L-rhamnosidase [Anaerolineae bacterium]
DVAGFFTKWLRDLAADQKADGSVPHVIPDALGHKTGGGGSGSSAWADAAVICPWTIYLCYGDKRLLEEQYASMAAWVGYIEEKAGDSYLWNSGFHFGDWLSFNSPSPAGISAITDTDLIATAFYAYSTSLLQKTARVLGKTADAKRYAMQLDKIKEAFCREFVSPNGRVANNTQTAYVLALMFDLLPKDVRSASAQRLAERVQKRNYHISTGFVGTPYLCQVLSENGQLDVAYRLLNQEGYPSWLYPVKQGATTIWERWDGQKPDGTFQDPGMNSFNHYAYGAIGEWMVRAVAGLDIDPELPGYKHVLVQPQPGGGLGWVKASIDSMYGRVACEWQVIDAGQFLLNVTVPANTTATVLIPAAQLAGVTEGGQPLDRAEGIVKAAQEGDAVRIEIGSGSYAFMCASETWAAYRKGPPALSTESTIRELLANEQARAILTRHLPQAGDPSDLQRAMDFSLREIAAYVPALTGDVLDAIDRELAELES